MPTEYMDRPCSRQYLPAVAHTAWNQVLLASFDGNPLPINQQCVAALHNQHVLMKVMDMLCGTCGLSASPKRHLAFIGSVEDISFDTGSRLIRSGDPVRGIPHELRKSVHAGACYRKAVVAGFCLAVITIYHQLALTFQPGKSPILYKLYAPFDADHYAAPDLASANPWRFGFDPDRQGGSVA